MFNSILEFIITINLFISSLFGFGTKTVIPPIYPEKDGVGITAGESFEVPTPTPKIALLPSNSPIVKSSMPNNSPIPSISPTPILTPTPIPSPTPTSEPTPTFTPFPTPSPRLFPKDIKTGFVIPKDDYVNIQFDIELPYGYWGKEVKVWYRCKYSDGTSCNNLEIAPINRPYLFWAASQEESSLIHTHYTSPFNLKWSVPFETERSAKMPYRLEFVSIRLVLEDLYSKQEYEIDKYLENVLSDVIIP